MYQLAFYVPVENVEEVKAALFAKGAADMKTTTAAAGRCWARDSFGPCRELIPTSGRLAKLRKYRNIKWR